MTSGELLGVILASVQRHETGRDPFFDDDLNRLTVLESRSSSGQGEIIASKYGRHIADHERVEQSYFTLT